MGENVIILKTDKCFARTAVLTSTASNKCATSPPLNNLRRRLLTNHSAMTADARKRTTMANCDAVRSRLAWGRDLTTLGSSGRRSNTGNTILLFAVEKSYLWRHKSLFRVARLAARKRRRFHNFRHLKYVYIYEAMRAGESGYTRRLVHAERINDYTLVRPQHFPENVSKPWCGVR